MSGNERFRPALPPWIRSKITCAAERARTGSLLDGLSLNTVCREAKCPNRGECWGRGTAAFMILGDSCTRNCKFCAVNHTQKPLPPDPEEPERLAEAAKKLFLKHVVVTSVTRDDLPDEGASAFARTTAALKKAVPGIRVEILTPDFNGSRELIEISMCEADVYNHNVETVERLTPLIRNKAQYRRSLEVLKTAFELARGKCVVKSGIMAGLGETDGEILRTIRDIRETGADSLTIGQYLPPSSAHWKLERYVTPETFAEWEKFARSIGFTRVASGPMVRSSYHADLTAGIV